MTEGCRPSPDQIVSPETELDHDGYTVLVEKAQDCLHIAYEAMGRSLFFSGRDLPVSTHRALQRFWKEQLSAHDYALVSSVMGWNPEIDTSRLAAQSIGVFSIDPGRSLADHDALRSIDWLPLPNEAEIEAMMEAGECEVELLPLAPPLDPSVLRAIEDEIPF